MNKSRVFFKITKVSAVISIFLFFINLICSPFFSALLQVEHGRGKSKLSLVYLRQADYHAKHGRYANDLESLEYEESDKTNFIVGMNPDCASGKITNSFDFVDKGLSQVSENLNSKRTEILARLKELPCATQDSFQVLVIGYVGSPQLDIMSINHQKSLIEESPTIFESNWQFWKKMPGHPLYVLPSVLSFMSVFFLATAIVSFFLTIAFKLIKENRD